MERKLRVFLCHASQDKPAVRDLCKRLKTEGWIDPWLDEEKLLPGQDWDLEIEKAVEAADAVIVFLSNNSVTKEGYIQRELRFVLRIADFKPEGTVFVIPVRLDDCPMPRRLSMWQYVDYFPENRKGWAFERLMGSLRTRTEKLNISFIGSLEKSARGEVELVDEEPKAERPAWYMLHCYQGFENKLHHNLKQRVESEGIRELVFDIIVLNNFPGYILVNMILTDESWKVVHNTPGITGFVGMGNNPAPLTQSEVETLLKSNPKNK